MSKYRYPGVKPFETSEANRFFGRERDLSDFYRLVAMEKLVLLFGKSGYGKSSLLNAGIIPLFAAEPLEKEDKNGGLEKVTFKPVTVRFGNFVEGHSSMPLVKLQEKLMEAFPEEPPEGAFLDFFPEKKTGGLWFACKRRSMQHLVLLFDQFEEFFSYPQDQQYAFRLQLAELLYTRIPQTMRDRWADLSKDEKNYLSHPMEVKAVFVIRSDRMSELNKLSEELPAILHKRYELKALTHQQAREAVVRPAALPQSEGFVAPSFGYETDALSRIISELSNSDQGAAAGIEAFQLQVLCQHFEQEVIRGNISGAVKHSDLPEIAHIFEAYYKSQLSLLNSSVQPAAQAIIEEGLLYDDPATGEARRLSVDADQLVHQFRNRGADPELLRQLENTFLLRREANNLGRYNYEISHDTLVAPILKYKRAHEIERKQRQTEEKAKEAEEMARAEQARVRELERLNELAKKNAIFAEINQKKAETNARRANLVALLASVLALASVYFWYVSRLSQMEAEQNAKAALTSRMWSDSLLIISQSALKSAQRSDSMSRVNVIRARESARLAEINLAQKVVAEQKAKQEQCEKYRSEALNFRNQKRFIDAIQAYKNAQQLVALPAEKRVLQKDIDRCVAEAAEYDFEHNRDIGMTMKAANDCLGALHYLRKAWKIKNGDKTVLDAIRDCESRK